MPFDEDDDDDAVPKSRQKQLPAPKEDENFITINGRKYNKADPLPKGAPDVEVDGKVYKAHYFKPGNTFGKAEKANNGRKPKQVTIQNMINIKQARGWAQTVGISRALEILNTVDDDTFLKGFLLLAPYLMPKMASVQQSSADKVHNIDAAQKVHTITIRDMTRGGRTLEIKDE